MKVLERVTYKTQDELANFSFEISDNKLTVTN